MKLKFFLPITIIMALLVVAGSGVSAHAEIERSIPVADSTVHGSPTLVEIWFSQEIQKDSTIEVVDATGKSVTTATAAVDLYDPERKHLTVALQPYLADGVYTVDWTSVSADDGDTETGSFSFTVVDSGTPVASPVASPNASPVVAHVSGSLQQQEIQRNEPGKIDERSFAIAVGAGAVVAVLIYGFWLLVRPRRTVPERNPLDRTPPEE